MVVRGDVLLWAAQSPFIESHAALRYVRDGHQLQRHFEQDQWRGLVDSI
jgi:hypothetical protein